ncbi:hypothetical protein GCM10028864_01790 [Microlunatus parietis]
MPTAATSPAPATAHRVRRQSVPPISVPSGSPSAVDELNPPMTRANALPRRSGGSSATAVLAAVDVMMPAPAAVTIRAARTKP